jgi:hypothetical protein
MLNRDEHAGSDSITTHFLTKRLPGVAAQTALHNRDHCLVCAALDQLDLGFSLNGRTFAR